MYKYETHLHTFESSACGHTNAAEYPAYYKSLGYSGIFITDHFFNGNCRISNELPWEERVNAFYKSYELARDAGEQINFPVFFGWESNFDGDEYLIYGLGKEWLLEHPDLLSYSRTRQYDEVHKSGGLVVQAHPFRERYYLDTIRLNPETCDAMEGYNTFNLDYNNYNAEVYCKENNIFMTAGSDLHKIGSIEPDMLCAMEFDTPISDEKDYVNRILKHEGSIVVTDRLRCPKNYILAAKLPIITNHREFV